MAEEPLHCLRCRTSPASHPKTIYCDPCHKALLKEMSGKKKPADPAPSLPDLPSWKRYCWGCDADSLSAYKSNPSASWYRKESAKHSYCPACLEGGRAFAFELALKLTPDEEKEEHERYMAMGMKEVRTRSGNVYYT